MKKIVLAVFLVLMAFAVMAWAMPVYAQGEDIPPEVPLSWIYAIWAAVKATPIALVTAFATVLVGYLSKTQPEKFRLEYFLFTMIISLVIGFLTILGQWDYGQVEHWFANGFLTWYIWKATVILAKILAKKLGWQPQISQPAAGPGPPQSTA